MTSALFLFVLNWIAFGIYDHIDRQCDSDTRPGAKATSIRQHIVGILISILMAPYVLVMTIYYIYKDITK